METIRTILSANLRRMRGSRTQAQVAIDCGFEVPSYNRWENCKAWPDPNTIEVLAKYYEVDPSEFYRAIVPTEPYQPVVKLSSFAKMLSCIPDDVFEMAQKIPLHDEGWEGVRGAMEAAIEMLAEGNEEQEA